MATLQDIMAQVRARKDELEAELGPLVDEYVEVCRVLGEQPKLGAAGTARSAARSGRVPQGKRQQQVIAALEGKPGQTGAELGEAIGVGKTQIYGLLKRLLERGLLTKSPDGRYSVAG